MLNVIKFEIASSTNETVLMDALRECLYEDGYESDIKMTDEYISETFFDDEYSVIVNVLFSFGDEDGDCYIALEYDDESMGVDGKTLQDHVDKLVAYIEDLITISELME